MVACTKKGNTTNQWQNAWKCCAPLIGNIWLCVIFSTAVVVRTLQISQRLRVKHAGAGMGGTARGRSSACEERQNCATLIHQNCSPPVAWNKPFQQLTTYNLQASAYIQNYQPAHLLPFSGTPLPHANYAFLRCIGQLLVQRLLSTKMLNKYASISLQPHLSLMPTHLSQWPSSGAIQPPPPPKRPIGAASCRQQHNQVSCQDPPPR